MTFSSPVEPHVELFFVKNDRGIMVQTFSNHPKVTATQK